MKRCVLTTVLTLMVLSQAFGADDVLDKYKSNYLALEEVDVDTIIDLLGSPDSTARLECAALTAIAFYKDFASAQKAIPILVDLLKNDESITVRAAAASALSRSNREDIAEELVDLAKDESLDPFLLASVIRALRTMGAVNKDVIDVAFQNAHSSNPWLRNESVMALGAAEEREDVERLVQEYLAFHEQPDSSLKAVRSHGVMDENRFDELSHLHALNLTSVARHAPDLLRPLLEHADPVVRLDAARAFVGQGDQAPIPVLVEMVQSGGYWEYKVTAAHLLARYGRSRLGEYLPTVVSVLKEALQDKHVEQGRGGSYRPVACAAYNALFNLGVRVDKPEGYKYMPQTYP